MRNKVVVIVGGGSGLGAELAMRYARADAAVALVGRTEAKLSKVASGLPSEARVYLADVSSHAQVKTAFATIYQELGGVDVLINSAGVGMFGPAARHSPGEVDQMIDINLKGTIFCTLEVLESMKANDQGQIINIISMSGKRAKAGESVYCASKFGVDGFTKAIALELEGTGVRVSGVYMGNMATDLWKDDKPAGLATFMHPADVADIVFEATSRRSHLSVEEIVIKHTGHQ